jgi:hypothetical protein
MATAEQINLAPAAVTYTAGLSLAVIVAWWL